MKTKHETKRMNPRGILAGLLTLFLSALCGCLLWQFGLFAIADSSPQWSKSLYVAVSIESHVGLWPFHGSYPVGRWIVGYSPFCLLVGFICAWACIVAYDVFLVPPKGSLIEDKVQKVRESGQDSPALEYLEVAAAVCPSLQSRSLAFDLLLAGHNVKVPPSKGLPDHDTPENLFKR